MISDDLFTRHTRIRWILRHLNEPICFDVVRILKWLIIILNDSQPFLQQYAKMSHNIRYALCKFVPDSISKREQLKPCFFQATQGQTFKQLMPSIQCFFHQPLAVLDGCYNTHGHELGSAEGLVQHRLSWDIQNWFKRNGQHLLGFVRYFPMLWAWTHGHLWV